MNPKLRTVSVLALTGALCLAAYGEMLGFYFTSIDAFPLLQVARVDTLSDLRRILTSPLGGGFPFGNYYRPVSEMSYALDYLLWGKNPAGYHLTAILLHFLNSALLFFVAKSMLKNHERGFLCASASAMLFAASPLAAGVVPSIARRQDMLLALVVGVCLAAFAKSMSAGKDRGKWHALALSAGFLAVFVKEAGFITPILVFLLFFVYSDEPGYGRRTTRGLAHSLPFFLFPLINTVLHVYLFGGWGVHGPTGRMQHFEAAMRSFYVLAGPLQLLGLGMTAKVAVMAATLLPLLVLFGKSISKHGLRGFLDRALEEKRRHRTFLVSFLIAFLAMFAASGKSLDFYHYLPYMAFTLVLVLVLAEKDGRTPSGIAAKATAGIFVLYTIACSPVVAKYGAWKDSSDITRKTIGETDNALRTDGEAKRIYLVNWPAFIGNESEMPGTNSNMLVSYSMDAWAHWSGLKAERDLEFVHVSYASFPAGKPAARIDYRISETKIEALAEGCRIYPSKIPSRGEVPFDFRTDGSAKTAGLLFKRDLRQGERIFLYDTGGIKVVGGGGTMAGATGRRS